MSELDIFHGPNAGYVLEFYELYQKSPDSVDLQMRSLFDAWHANGNTLELCEAIAPKIANQQACPDVHKVVAAARIARLVRELGHKESQLDPLGSPPPGDPELTLEHHGITRFDLENLPASVIGGPKSLGVPNAAIALDRLREAYSGPIGYEDDHIQCEEERRWFRTSIESGEFLIPLDHQHKIELLERLTEAEVFEQYLQTNFPGKKRFSLEGADALVPILDQIVHEAAIQNTQEVVMGMAHRGRLNVLAHILGKPYAAILQGFQQVKSTNAASMSSSGAMGYTGDVKYHLGFRRAYQEKGFGEMPITLAPNPSHLEFVNPVVMGRARAAQEARNLPGKPVRDMKASLCVLIHGDAAFPGQGIVAESLNLGRLSGYRVGGVIHIILNNQVGFTTSPVDSRSTHYCSDLAKGFEMPIVHVNADDPEACIAVVRMAQAYREKFYKDFLIDLVGYRRHGHNEQDEPAYTQPKLYSVIRNHPTVRTKWAKRLIDEGVITEQAANKMVEKVRIKLDAGRSSVPSDSLVPSAPTGLPATKNGRNGHDKPVQTRVPAKRLVSTNSALLYRPDGFSVDPKLEKILSRRANAIREGGIDWGHAEALAFATILQDGTPIRMSGQDSERGTFGHRHLVLHDPHTDEECCSVLNLPDAKASFAVYNSPLSENAALGFEYGYSVHADETLVLWEAQFGDFANGCQVIIDQFLASGKAKWQQSPGLVLLLPHGYEGMGPEHSSARIERFLQLCADNNLRIVNCSNSGQYFHVLRRQAKLLRTDPRPLVVMTPKSLLREPRASCTLEYLSEGMFQPVIDDPRFTNNATADRVVFCSGKVYVDLLKSTHFAESNRVAVIRVEELYPFPDADIQMIVNQYGSAREWVWMQEEPHNMGAWNYISSLIGELLPDNCKLQYVGRKAMASTAVGSEQVHLAEQDALLAEAMTVGANLTKRSELANVR